MILNTKNTGISVWEEFRETYELPFAIGDLKMGTRLGVQRKDGMRVTHMSFSMGSLETYRVQSASFEFYFDADRREGPELSDKPTNRYIVKVYAFHREWPGDRRSNSELIRAHAKDIESALIHFPVGGYWPSGTTSVEEVLFNTSDVTRPPHLVHADDL